MLQHILVAPHGALLIEARSRGNGRNQKPIPHLARPRHRRRQLFLRRYAARIDPHKTAPPRQQFAQHRPFLRACESGNHHFGVAGLRARSCQAGLRARLPHPHQPRPQLTHAHPLRRHKTHEPLVQQHDVAMCIARDRAEAVACPFRRILADISAIGLQLFLRCHELLPIVLLPGRGTHVRRPPGRAQVAIDLRDPSLEAADHITQLVLAVVFPAGNAQKDMNVVRHHHELNDLRARIPLAHRAKRICYRFAEFVQHALYAHDRTKDRLVERRLYRHEKRAVRIVDVRVPQYWPVFHLAPLGAQNIVGVAGLRARNSRAGLQARHQHALFHLLFLLCPDALNLTICDR